MTNDDPHVTYARAMRWEYTHVTAPSTTGGRDEMMLRVSALGTIGWEAVGLTSIDQTLGINATTVLLKRALPPLPDPPTMDPSWYPDPFGRHELRHWDGERWTQHVSDRGSTDTDWPITRT